MEMNVPDFDFERSFFLGVVNIPVNGYVCGFVAHGSILLNVAALAGRRPLCQ
jgi:hypothetical protein